MTRVPDGMTPGQFAAHPIRQVIRHAGYFGPRALPSSTDLDALQLSAETRLAVVEAALDVAELHDAGSRLEAWRRSDELAADILASLDPADREPKRGPDPTDGLDPDQLADLVRRDEITGTDGDHPRRLAARVRGGAE